MSRHKVSWGSYFIELLVVIIGISIAFAIEPCSEKRKDVKDLAIALESKGLIVEINLLLDE